MYTSNIRHMRYARSCGGSEVVFQCRLKLTFAFFDNPEYVRGGLSSFPEITLFKNIAQKKN